MKVPAGFNPSLRMPIVDIVVACVLVVVTGYFWFHTKGETKLENSKNKLRSTQAENAAELQATIQTRIDAQEELKATILSRDDNAQIVEFLKDRIEIEREAIREAQERDERYTDEVLDLRTNIQRSRGQRRANRTDVMEADRSIEELRGLVADLEDQSRERNEEIARLDDWILSAQVELERNPASHFPEKSGLTSLVAVTKDDQAVLVGLSLAVKVLGPVDVGIAGSLGLSTDGETSCKEGGLYANLPVVPHRTSIDFEGGVSNVESRKNSRSETDPFAGATLRFAPSRGQRLFLTGGARYSHEELAVRLGVALGRR
ncbi:MAG: hypothetical protein KAY24_17855 [Candidatus Eisenbacteria sp.]|nr:hypothetical protein [Candidatus Eisenbacteria bacterium]